LGIKSKFFIIPVIASILIFGAIGLGLSSDAFAKGQGQPKVTICHVDQETGEEKTISISNKALSKHVANHIGDHSGECVDEPEPVCGDGNQEAPEECDDGNTVTETCNYSETSCTVCAADCTNQDGATSFCGDSNIDSANGETCDDGNNANGDGCSSICEIEPFCGDGVVNQPSEQCDDGNNTPGDGCDAFCVIETETFPDILISCICNNGETIPVALCVESCQGALEQICEPLCLDQTETYANDLNCFPSDPFCA